MVRIIRHFAANQPSGADRKPLFDEERPLNSVTDEDAFEDILAGLTHRPDIASTDISPRNIAANEPAPPKKLPSVEEFRFDEAAARNMASKLAPAHKPRVKSRRPRYRSLNRDRWRLPNEADEHYEERPADRRTVSQAVAASGSNGRGLFWSFCASLLIIMGTSAAFGFVQPLNDLLPTRMADFLSGVSEELSAGLLNGADRSADVEVAGGAAASDPPPVSPDKTMASPVVARAVPTTSVRVAARPAAIDGGAGSGELPGAANDKAFELGATVLELEQIDGAEFAASKSEMALAAAAPAPAAADQANNQAPLQPAVQPSAKADPVQLARTMPAATPEPAAGEAQPAISPLSPAQINRLLARGKELLESGDIASARLLFLRVAATGDGRGAKGVGMTYDPRVYARLPVTGLTPDRQQAELWYKKAGENSTFTLDLNTAADTGQAPEAGSAQWNADCASKYKSFEPSTGLYTALSGAKRPCRLP